MKAMLLAAGRGERMGALTQNCPKPLLPVAGKALLQHQLERLSAAGIEEVVINAAYLQEQIIHFVEKEMDTDIRVSLSLEPERLETGGGIAKALPLLGDAPFILVNSDVWTDFPLSTLIQRAFDGVAAHLVLVENPQHHAQGDFVLEKNGWVSNAGPDRKDCLTFSGISVISPHLFEAAPKGCYPLAPMLKEAMIDNQVSGEYYSGYWMDVGTPERLCSLENDIKAGRQ